MLTFLLEENGLEETNKTTSVEVSPQRSSWVGAVKRALPQPAYPCFDETALARSVILNTPSTETSTF